jgi:hypothetical protein
VGLSIVGGPNDNYDPDSGLAAGAAWVFTYTNGVWTQQVVGTSAWSPSGTC